MSMLGDTNIRHRPRVSVIITTYNWSAVLRCALRSVLGQSFQDFEVLVIGDGCTDDSEAVVRSFGDDRLIWANLPTNSGSQSTPNNHGFALSSGEFIAYLGHDDIWYPTHLQSLVALMDGRAADLAIGTAMIYGAPGSGLRMITGLFEPGGFTTQDCAPPSSFMLRRTLLERIGPWRSHDYDLLCRALAAGANFVGSDEMTVFKFSAALRRDCYRRKVTTEQEAMLARIATGIDFRQAEWAALTLGFLTGRSMRVAVFANTEDQAPGETHARTRRFKGLDAPEPPAGFALLQAPQRWLLTGETFGHEWHPLQETPKYGVFRWTGPSLVSTIQLPVSAAQHLDIEMHILDVIASDVLTGLRLSLNGADASGTIDQTAEGTFLLRTRYRPPATQRAGGDGVQITIQVARTDSFLHAGRGSDPRFVGIAVNWIQASPLAG